MNRYLELKTLEELEEFIRQNEAVLIYFSNETCGVCKVLKPKVLQLLETKYPELLPAFVDTESALELAGQNRIFSIPSILLFFDGKEFQRFSRNMGIEQIDAAIARPYGMMF